MSDLDALERRINLMEHWEGLGVVREDVLGLIRRVRVAEVAVENTQLLRDANAQRAERIAKLERLREAVEAAYISPHGDSEGIGAI